MTAAHTPAPATELLVQIAGACERIAPTWPLDQFIAVNPYWGWRSSHIADAAARLGVLAGTSLTMPRSWFREEWRAGRLAEHHLHAAARDLDAEEVVDAAMAALRTDDEEVTSPLQRMALVTDLRDADGEPLPGRTWSDVVVHQISQHCASHVDEWQASWSPDTSTGLFTAWRVDPSVTHGVSWRRGRSWARKRLASLPNDPTDTVGLMLDELGIDPDGREAYLTALLLSVNGWAAWFAYRRWQARLEGADDHDIVELLAIRLAWEWLLDADANDGADARRTDWAASWTLVDAAAAETAERQRIDWLLQAAVERTFQEAIVVGAPHAVAPTDAPQVQALFCIDVRSEVFRRAFESTSTAVSTRGFAGFFGLPIAYTPIGSTSARPQLPGLLAPSLVVTDVVDGDSGSDDDTGSDALASERAGRLQRAQPWHTFRTNPSSMFSYVESMGLMAGVKLVGHSLPHRHEPTPWEHEGLSAEHGTVRPRLSLVHDDPATAAAIGARVLTTMGLTDAFAPLVMLCGHGSHSANNAHAAGLDCGACGGHTGEVNARVLADLLDAPSVRREMAALGVHVPDDTWFVAALHDTTTDTVRLFDVDRAPAAHRAGIDRLTALLDEAGTRARRERAASLGLGDIADDDTLEQRIHERANDWSQVRPEWGLAGNAAFVVAPRWRTSHLDLGGRCFLHDYDWQLDADGAVLTQIMTAPMVVTNWINLQYHASTVDNRRFGSGDKTLHNVVGGRVGVFEGNGGDLRIGLATQSLHDGRTLRHRPLRLSVFIEAPRDTIDAVLDAHAVVRELVLHGWLHLLRIDTDDGHVEHRTPTRWAPR